MEDWIKIIAVLIFFVGPILLRALGGREVQPDRPPVKLPEAPPKQQGGQPRSLEDEIAEFLRESKRQGDDPPRRAGDTFQVDDDDFVAAEPVQESRQRYGDRSSTFGEEQSGRAALAQAIEVSGPDDNPYAAVDINSLSSEPLTYEGLGDEYDYAAIDAEPDDPHAEQRDPHAAPLAAAVTGDSLVELISRPESLRSAFILGEIFRRPGS